MTIAFSIIVILLLLLILRALQTIARNQVQMSVHRSNIHQVEIATLNAIRKVVAK